MESQPLVSIILITMNHEKFIEQACISAIYQTYPNIEIIFLDNASEDKTYEIAERIFTGSGIRHKMIRNTESFTISKNLNILVSNASGKYISILSGDDWYTEDSISEKVKYFSENPSTDFVLTDGYKHYQDEGKTINAYTDKEKDYIKNNTSHFFYDNVTGNKTVNVGTFVKKELLIQYPFDENVNTEDWDMNLRLISKGFTLGFIDKKLFYYRIVSTSLSRNWKLMKESYEKVTDKYFDYIKADPSLYRKYQLHLLQFRYEILLSETSDTSKRKKLLTEWKREKYRLKYKNPLLFFKLLMIR